MKCPSCNKHTCSFAEWVTSSKTLKNQTCPHCRQTLRVSLRTWIVMVLLFALFPISFYGLVTVARHYGMAVNHGNRMLFIVGAILPPVGLLGFFEWLTGTYRTRS